MQPVFSLSKRSIDQLESDLIHQFADISAREYAFLVDLREFDLRQGWKAWLFNHCSEWLSIKCGIDTATGRENSLTQIADSGGHCTQRGGRTRLCH